MSKGKLFVDKCKLSVPSVNLADTSTSYEDELDNILTIDFSIGYNRAGISCEILRNVLRQWIISNNRMLDNSLEARTVINNVVSAVQKNIPDISNNETTPENSGVMCNICLSRNVQRLFLPCRHLVTCANCAILLEKCPVCRTTITHSMDVFLP